MWVRKLRKYREQSRIVNIKNRYPVISEIGILNSDINLAVNDEVDESEEKKLEVLLSLPRYVGIFVTQKTWEKNFYQSPGRQFLGIIFLYLVSPHTPSPEVSKHIPPPLVH